MTIQSLNILVRAWCGAGRPAQNHLQSTVLPGLNLSAQSPDINPLVKYDLRRACPKEDYPRNRAA